MTFRWFLGLCIVKNRVVGRIHQLPAGPDPIARGSVQKQAPWKAHGMRDDWDDTDLGTFDARGEAGQAIQDWFKHWEGRAKAPCNVHERYRSDCVSCEARNK